MDDLIKLLEGEYSFLRLDEKGNFIYTNLPFENVSSFLDIVMQNDKAKAAKLIFNTISNGYSDGIIYIKNEEGYSKYFFKFILKNDEIWGIAKEIEKFKPSFKTDFLGNVIETSDEWRWMINKNLFDIIENREKLLKLISEAIEKGEYEENAEINDKKFRIKVRTTDLLEFYIEEDIQNAIRGIAISSNKKEILEKLCKLLDLLSYENYEIELDGEKFKKGIEGEIFFDINFEYGHIRIYSGKKNEYLNLIPIAVSIAFDSIEKPSFVLDSLPICIIDNKGKIISINKKFEELTGYGNEIIGKNINEYVNHKNFLNENIIKWKGKNKEFWVKEKIIEGRDRKYLILEDITEEKEKMDEAEFFNSILRHDIFNKNEIALGYIGLLEKTNIGKKQKGLIEKIKRSIEESNELIHSVRKLEEVRKEGKLKKIRIKNVIRDVCESLREEAKNAGMEINYNISNVTVIADEFIKEVFSNIIRNSIEHSKGNMINIYGKDLDGIYEIVIEDDGKGIPEEYINKIFEEGWKHESKGSGLGLYIVKKLIERYGGKINVESEIGKGAKFILQFRKTKGEENFLRIRL